MEHFAVIQTLCRIGLEGSDPRFRKQVERLRDRLRSASDQKAVAALDRLLVGATSEHGLAPSVVEVSRTLVTGDELTSNVHPPSDRETSVPLAEVILEPGAGKPAPIFTETLQLALDAMLDEWKRVETLRAMGVEPSRSCLIYGPPGTGKTLTAFWLAEQLHLPIVNARIDGLVSSFLGTTARNIANLFAFANRYRCVLVLDEFDALAKMRDDPHEVGEIKRVVNTLLQNLDSRAGTGLTIAITNHDSLLDSAVWRRFENHIRIDLPDQRTRVAMLENFLRPLSIDEDVIKTLAFIVGHRSGSYLKNFADSLKRVLVLGNVEVSAAGIIRAARTLVPRMSLENGISSPARLFVHDESSFVGALLESGIGIRQASLAEMLEVSQSTISRYSREFTTRTANEEVAVHAE
ncbi:AAA family ATPase [Phyllobacterium zundukense]|uniref:ATP-binding protein n=1 Tax=Phyllobacterium zundukense TaxID=1867719 RepID=A0ACD4CW30_9HYPH|nr:ATP-binding protein [Phyllobacterium zundukense]UXN57795.1 ATP-binding protein [Phyllobacterium zundukense]